MESELKLTFPTKEALYQTITSSWFLDAIQVRNEYVEEYENRYFDTQDRALREDKISIRVRRINGEKYLHTVKLGGKSEAGFSRRYEWNQEFDTADFHIRPFLEKAQFSDDPVEILSEALKGVCDSRLCEICQTRFTRKIVKADFKKSFCEICLDVGSCIAGSKTAPICEMEIELISGNVSEVIELGQLVIEHSEGEFSDVSKLARCLELMNEEPSI